MFLRIIVLYMILATGLDSHASTPCAAVVSAKALNGYINFSKSSKALNYYGWLDEVIILAEKYNKKEKMLYYLIKGTEGKLGCVGSGVVPNYWVKSLDLTKIDTMLKWSGCWPIASIVFEDGVVDVSIEFDKSALGSVTYSEGSSEKRQLFVYQKNKVLLFRDMIDGAKYLFYLNDDSKQVVSPKYLIRDQTRRNCN